MTASSAAPAPVRVHPVSRRDAPALAVILLVAALLRVGDLGRLSEYTYDHATLSTLALDLVSGKALPLVGIQSSAGIANSPMTVYALAIPYLFTDNPATVAAIIGAFNLLGVGLLWLLAYRYFGPLVAFVAGLAYAVHPHAVYYSRAIWAQDYHTPILLAGFLLALYGFVEGKRWAQAVALPVFVVGLQIHYAAWTLLPAFFWVVGWGRRNMSRRALVVSVVLAGLTLIPFAVGLSQTNSAAQATAGSIVERLDTLSLRNKALLYAVRLATGLGGPWVGTELVGYYDTIFSIPNALTALWLVLGAAVALGLVTIWLAWGRFWGALLALWAVLPFAVFVPNWTGVYPHYFVPNLPAGSLLAALGVAWLLARIPARAARIAALSAFMLILLTQAAVFAGFLRQAATTDTELYDTPVSYLQSARAPLLPYRDVLISGGTTRESGYPVWKGLLYYNADCVRELVIASGGVAVFPAHPFAVITPPGALPPAPGDLYKTDSPLTVPLRQNEGAYTIDRFDAAPRWNGPEIIGAAPARFDNGVTLTGYQLTPERVYLRWRLPGPVERQYQYFAHFLDAGGEKIGQQDASYWPGVFWCEEDTLITWIDSDIPDGTHTLRVGMYRLENGGFVNSSVLDDTGNASGPWVDIPLTEGPA